MKLIQEFGIDPILFLAQVVNFLIIFFLLKKYLYKPIFDELKNRENTIKEGLKQAEESRLLLEKAEEREKSILKKAQLDAKNLLDDAKAARVEMLEKSEADTRLQVEKMLKEARAQIEFETKEAEKRLSRNISMLSVQFLKKSLSGLFTEKDQETVVKDILKKMKERVD